MKVEIIEELIKTTVHEEYPLIERTFGVQLNLMIRMLTEVWTRRKYSNEEIIERMNSYLIRTNRQLMEAETEEEKKEIVETMILNSKGQRIKSLIEAYHKEIPKENLLTYCLEAQIAYDKMEEAIIADGTEEAMAQYMVMEQISSDLLTEEE